MERGEAPGHSVNVALISRGAARDGKGGKLRGPALAHHTQPFPITVKLKVNYLEILITQADYKRTFLSNFLPEIDHPVCVCFTFLAAVPSE